MAIHTSAITQSAPTTTSTLKRTVADTVRHLFPGQKIQALVASGPSGVKDGVKRKKGLIGKRRVESAKYEAYTYTPLAVEFTVATGGTNTCVVSDADGLMLTMLLFNTTSGEVMRIGAISSTTLTVTRVGSASDATLTAGDKLLAMAPAYPENSSDPYILSKDADNLYNHTQIARFAVAISATAKGAPHYGGEYWPRVKQESVTEGLRKLENTMLFSERASGTNEKTTDSTLADTFRTMRGLWFWAQQSQDMGGNMTIEKFCHDMAVTYVHESVSVEDKKLLLVGTKGAGIINSWVRDKLVLDQPADGYYKTFGVMIRTVMTDIGPVDIMVHDAFNRGDMAKNGLLICPEKLDYVHLRDRDIKPKNGIQSNSTDGYEDEIMGEVSICPNDAGYSITKLTNIYA